MKALLFVAAGLVVLFSMVTAGRDRHPLLVDAQAQACPPPSANPCAAIDCRRRDVSKERIA